MKEKKKGLKICVLFSGSTCFFGKLRHVCSVFIPKLVCKHHTLTHILTDTAEKGSKVKDRQDSMRTILAGVSSSDKLISDAVTDDFDCYWEEKGRFLLQTLM